VSTLPKLLALLTFSPPLATSYRASWQSGGDNVQPSAGDRLIITIAGTVSVDIQATQVAAAQLTVLPSGGLRDVSGSSQNASIPVVGMLGTWGDASQPMFLTDTPTIALDYGGQVGVGAGDALLLRFNQPVAQVPVGSKDAIDALLRFNPPFWAANYSGAWLDFTALLITVAAVHPEVVSNASLRAEAGVGSLRVTVLSSGGLTPFDGTAAASNASAVVGYGSWGDVVCDGALLVFSGASLTVAFSPPAMAATAPANYTITVSSDPTYPPSNTVTLVVAPGQSRGDVVLPTGLFSTPSSVYRYVVPGLTADTRSVCSP
jgi:hypothetical protein